MTIPLTWWTIIYYGGMENIGNMFYGILKNAHQGLYVIYNFNYHENLYH